jgi:glycerate 2-kinase
MKILIAPNAFKGTMKADEAAGIIKEAIEKVVPETQFKLCPIADGGDGTFLLLAKALKLPVYEQVALDPLGRPVIGCYSVDSTSSKAFLDVSTVSGVKWLAEEERDPFTTCTYGTGELIRAAVERGANHIKLGLGGSATIDMGIGILRALGYMFLDMMGREISMFSPGYLGKIRHIQRPVKKRELKFTLICDVNNPFFGQDGAVAVFGPQKGLLPEDQGKLEEASKEFYELLRQKSQNPLEDRPYFGAAGGIGLGLSAFYPTELVKGPDFFFEKVGMANKVDWADLVITGEGRYDSQSSAGKGSFELMKHCHAKGKKIYLITSGDTPGEGFAKTIFLPPLPHKGDSDAARALLYRAVKDQFGIEQSQG